MGTGCGRKQLRVISGAAVAAAIVTLVGAAVASTYGRTVVALPFTTRQPARSTGLRISIHYRDEHDPNAKPKTFHKLEVELPAGIRIDQHVVPACTASDSELMAQGPSACPRSKVGDGTVTLMTGFPPPGDTFATDVTVLQGQGELLDVFRVRSHAMRCRRRVVVRFGGGRVRTNWRGHAALVRRLRHAGRRRAVATRAGCRRAVATVRVARGSG